MSYRTWANDYQIFDNNDGSKELIDELIRQGMAEPDDGCYSFEVTDINPVIKIVDAHFEKQVRKKEKYGVKMYDFSRYVNLLGEEPLYVSMQDLITYGIIFQSYNFLNYLLRTGCIERVQSTPENPVYKIVKPITISAG